MRVVPSGRTTSSMVRFPTTTSRGGGVISSPLEITLFGRNLAIGKADVEALVPVHDERPDVPDDPDHHHANHEGEGQGPGHRERGVDRAVEDEHEQESDQHDHPAHPREHDRRYTGDPMPAAFFPDLSQSIG